jgi:hypothetical protein
MNIDMGKKILKWWPVLVAGLTLITWATRLTFQVDALAEKQEVQKTTIKEDMGEIKSMIKDTNTKIRELEKYMIWKK